MTAVVLETNFFLIIIFTLIVMYWFATMSEVKMGSHKKAFQMVSLFIMLACVCRIGCVYMDYSFEINHEKQEALAFVHMAYLSFLMVAYSVYGFLCLCFLNYNVRMKRRVLVVYFAPCAIAVLMVMISGLTGWVFYIDPLMGYRHGSLHFIISIIPVIYCIPGMLQLIYMRKYLPQNLVYATIATSIGFVFGIGVYLLTGSKPIMLGTIVLIVLLQLFSVLFYDSFWDEASKTLNAMAFQFFVKKCMDRKKQIEVIIVQMAGFSYFCNTKEKDLIEEVCKSIVSDLKSISKLNTIYYLDNGAFAVAIDDTQLQKNRMTMMKEIREYCYQVRGESVKKIVSEFDIYDILMPEDTDNPKAILTYINRNQGMGEQREEKVRFLKGNQIHLDQALREESVIGAIAGAVQERKFQVYYQPIYSVKEKKFVSAEALVRLQDDKLGFIPPDEFIPLAEERGMINEIGMQVLEQVCQTMAKGLLQNNGVSYLEVNLSVCQFMDDSFERQIANCLEKYQLSRSRINFEITETATPFEQKKMQKMLLHMAEQGFHFSLDDYGTGYSNLEAVMEYPLDLIKMDKSIIWSAFEDEKAMGTMKSLIDMFHRLGFFIVAEGIETKKMVDVLSELGVDYLQGFYYSKPLPLTEYLEFLIKNNG